MARAPSPAWTGEDARPPSSSRREREPRWCLGASGSFPHNLIVNSEWVAPASLRPRSGQARRLSGRHLAFPLVILSLAPLLSTSADARNKHSSSLAVPDRGYTSALAAANRFLQAWQNQDRETGLLMLTDAAKQASSQERMDSFFSSGNDAAYEIARGRKLKGRALRLPGHAVYLAFRLEPARSPAEIADHCGSCRQRRMGNR